MQAPIWQNLRTCWSLAYAMTKKKGLTFTYEGADYEVFADQPFQKVFYNLIDNSLKHGKNVFFLYYDSYQVAGQDLVTVMRMMAKGSRIT